MTPDESIAEFSRLVDAHYRSLFRFAMSLCSSEGTASDLVQQTFYNWAHKGHQLRDRTRAKSWLFTTLHREFLQLVRRESRLVPMPEDDADAPESVLPAPEPKAVDSLEAEDLYGALAEVPEVFRVPLTLFYLEEFSYNEIADMLSVPIGTVMSRLSRGKQKLRSRLAARWRIASDQPVRFEPRKEVPLG